MQLLEILALVGVLAFAGASFFFALSETALFALGKWQARHLSTKSSARGEIVFHLLERPRDLLATIVLANSFCNAMVVILGIWLGISRTWPLGWLLLGLFILILFFNEVTPKTLAVRMPEIWSLRVARPMRFFVVATAPLRELIQLANQWILKKLTPRSVEPHVSITDEDYEELIEVAYQKGTLAHAEKEIIYEIVNLDQQTAADVMLPRTQIAGVSIDMTREEMIVSAREYKHRRLVLYDENLDNIVGFLNTRTLLLHTSADLDEIMEMPSFVPETMNLLQLFKSLQRQRRGIAVVLDEFGGTAGLVTMEDILEEMVGRIRHEDESDEEDFKKLGDGRWEVVGGLRIDEFQDEYPRLRELPEVDTLAGLMLARMEIIPCEGQSMDYCGLRFTVLEADERRVQTLLLEDLSKQ